MMLQRQVVWGKKNAHASNGGEEQEGHVPAAAKVASSPKSSVAWLALHTAARVLDVYSRESGSVSEVHRAWDGA